MTKLSKSNKGALAITSFTITAAAIVSPVLITQFQSEQNPIIADPYQKLLDLGGYQDPKLGFKVDLYGNLVQALAISPMMNFKDLTNQTLNQKLQALGLNNYQLKIISASTDQDVVKLSFKQINDEDQNQNEIITISDFNGSLKPINPTVINTRPLTGGQGDVKAGMDQKLPLTFDGNFSPNQQVQLNTLSDQNIKKLINRGSFSSDLPLFNQSQQNGINGNSLDQKQKDQFQFQFVPVNQSVELKITFNDPDRITSGIFDSDQDQGIVNPNAKQGTLITNESQGLGTLAMVDEISAKQHPFHNDQMEPNLNQALIYLMMNKRMVVNFPKVPFAATGSEILYGQEQDPEGFFNQPVFKNLVSFKDDLLKAYFPDLKYRFGYDFVANRVGTTAQPATNQFLKLYDQDFANDLGSDQLVVSPYLEVDGKKYRIYDKSSWDETLQFISSLNGKYFINRQDLAPILFATTGNQYSYDLIETQLLDGTISQTFTNQIAKNQLLVQTLNQGLINPNNQNEQEINKLIQQTFQLQTKVLSLNNQASFNILKNQIKGPKPILNQGVNSTQYQQPAGTYNSFYQTLSVEINQKVHQVRFKDGNLKFNSEGGNNQEYLIVQALKFNRQNKTIDFKFRLSGDLSFYGDPILNGTGKGFN